MDRAKVPLKSLDVISSDDYKKLEQFCDALDEACEKYIRDLDTPNYDVIKVGFYAIMLFTVQCDKHPSEIIQEAMEGYIQESMESAMDGVADDVRSRFKFMLRRSILQS